MDAYMNNITRATGRIDFAKFSVFSTNMQGNIAACNVNLSQEQQIGFEDVIIINNATGSYNLHVGATDSRRIIGSPFSYKIVSGIKFFVNSSNEVACLCTIVFSQTKPEVREIYKIPLLKT